MDHHMLLQVYRISIILCEWNAEERRGWGVGGEGNFPKAVSQNLGLNPHSLLCTSRWAFKKWIVNLVQMANWNTRCMLRDVISPKWPDNRNKGMSKI